MNKVRWGILSTANIGVKKVIPAMQKGKFCSIEAIASRDAGRAAEVSSELNIPKSYGSYEELLADDEIDAIYNPLPNHLHVPWTLKAMEAGKHVLCEKPIGLNADEAEKLLQRTSEFPDLKVMEAFMYRFHPQWAKAKSLIKEDKIGPIKTVHSFFTYFNDDPDNIRNMADIGGGGLMDIGCYCISSARYIFGEEPDLVFGNIDIDPKFKTDRLASGMLNFPGGTATFTCSTQVTPYQNMKIFGTKGLIEIEVPFNSPIGQPTSVILVINGEKERFKIPASNHYTLQGDAFSKAVLDDEPVATSLADAVSNMKVIDAMFESARKKKPVYL